MLIHTSHPVESGTGKPLRHTLLHYVDLPHRVLVRLLIRRSKFERIKTRLIEMKNEADGFVPQRLQVLLPTHCIPSVAAAYRRAVVGGEAGVGFEVGVEDLDADKAAVHISVDIKLLAFKDELPSNNAPAFIDSL